jgi:hypothetical protein
MPAPPPARMPFNSSQLLCLLGFFLEEGKVDKTDLAVLVPIKFVAAEAGCFPPGPLVVFADIFENLI